MKRTAIALLFAAAALCGAQQIIPLDTVLPAETARKLETEGTLQKISYKDRSYKLSLVPQTELGIAASKIWTAKKAPVFVAETLNLIKKVPGNTGSDVELISKILRSFSTMKGIEYFSNSNQSMQVLYYDIYTINNPTAKARIFDQTGGSANGMKLYTDQQMATFGSGVYEYSFKQDATGVLCVSQNMDPVTYSIFKLVKPGNFKFALYVTDLGDQLLVYSLVQAEFFAIASLEARLTGAFSSRSEAVYKWFETMYLQSVKEVVKND